MLTEANGIPLALSFAGANRHDIMVLGSTRERIAVRRPRPPRRQPQRLFLNNGYDVGWGYPLLARFGLTTQVRERREEAWMLRRISGARAAQGRRAGP